jgi:adenine-specific DNA-methyltransferase
MPVKYIPYYPNTVQGQAILDNITRTRRVLRYRDNGKVVDRIKRGMPYYELGKSESVGSNPENLLIRGECISACAYLKDKGIKVDLVYVDPPFASGADYAKKVYLRRNPKLAEKIAKAEEELLATNGNSNGGVDLEELRAFEEKMYGDIWNKEDYLNWMYENLTAIKEIVNESGSIYVHLGYHIGHYVKILMDEIFGQENLINDIVWHYETSSGAVKKKFIKNHGGSCKSPELSS